MSYAVLSPSAQNDLVEIWHYIGRDSPENADDFVDRILETCHETLAASPEIGRLRPELALGVRSYPVQKYLIFYRPREEGVEIVRVIHGARDLPKAFSSVT